MYNYCDFVLTSHESDSEQIRINFDEFLDFGVTICHRLAQGVAFSLTYRVNDLKSEQMRSTTTVINIVIYFVNKRPID